jgi:hypothetical protein
MSAGETRCRSCGTLTAAGQHFCPNCGQQLALAGSTPAPPVHSVEPLASAFATDDAPMNAVSATARRRVNTGLLLMIIAFAMLWIPYLSDLGSLIAFIGIILLGLGRHAYDEPFRRWVVRGAVLVVTGLAVAFLSGVIFASEVTSTAMASGETLPAFIASLQPALETLLVGAFLGTIFLALGYVCLPYGKADQTSRGLLCVAALLALAIAAVEIEILWQQIIPTLENATSSGTLNLGPIDALQTEGLELGLLQIVPDLLFLYAYYRTRSQLP